MARVDPTFGWGGTAKRREFVQNASTRLFVSVVPPTRPTRFSINIICVYTPRKVRGQRFRAYARDDVVINLFRLL